jgi:hypothetical protein
MIKINGKTYKPAKSFLIDKQGNIIVDGVIQGSTRK